jgi:hypothetical protein
VWSYIIWECCRVDGESPNEGSLLQLAGLESFRACHERRIKDSWMDEGRSKENKKSRSEEGIRRFLKRGRKSNSVASEWGEIDIVVNCKTGANRDSLKGCRKSTREQEIVKCGPE